MSLIDLIKAGISLNKTTPVLSEFFDGEFKTEVELIKYIESNLERILLTHPDLKGDLVVKYDHEKSQGLLDDQVLKICFPVIYKEVHVGNLFFNLFNPRGFSENEYYTTMTYGGLKKDIHMYNDPHPEIKSNIIKFIVEMAERIIESKHVIDSLDKGEVPNKNTYTVKVYAMENCLLSTTITVEAQSNEEAIEKAKECAGEPCVAWSTDDYSDFHVVDAQVEEINGKIYNPSSN